MLYRYQIVHSEASKEPLDQQWYPLDDEGALREYSLLDTPFRLFFHGRPEIAASMQPAVPATKGVIVSLKSDLPRQDVDDALEQFLIRHNAQIRPLCLVVKERAIDLTSG